MISHAEHPAWRVRRAELRKRDRRRLAGVAGAVARWGVRPPKTKEAARGRA